MFLLKSQSYRPTLVISTRDAPPPRWHPGVPPGSPRALLQSSLTLSMTHTHTYIYIHSSLTLSMIPSTHICIYIYSGWWFQPSEKYYVVSWGGENPNIWNSKKMQTVVQHKAVAEVSKIRNLYERFVVVNLGWQGKSTEGPTGGWSFSWSGCNGCSGHLTHNCWMKCGVVQ